MAGKKKLVPSSQIQHRQQMLVQVWLPLGVAIAIVVALAVLVVSAAGESSPVVGQAANISTIYMIAPLIILSLLYAALVGLMIYLVAKLIRKVPSITRPVQAFFGVLSFKTGQISDQVANPFIKVRSFYAAFRKVMRRR